MNVANIATGVDDAIHRHAPKLKEIDLLSVHFCNTMVRVGHSNEWNIFACPISLKWFKSIGTYCENFCAARNKACVGITKARQLRTTVKSHKSAQEGKQNWLLTIVCGETNGIAGNVVQFEIKSGFPNLDQKGTHSSRYFSTTSMNSVGHSS